MTEIRKTRFFKKLRDVDPRILAEFTKNEHPQTIALIMAHLLPEQAAEILERYSPTLQCEVIKRTATLQGVPDEFIEEVAKALEKEIPQNASSNRKLGGARFIAEILNKMGHTRESSIISALEESDPGIASEVRNSMVSFDDFLKLDDKNMQALLRKISPGDLSPALTAVDEKMREKIYRNMSKRAAKKLKENIRMTSPLRFSEAEVKQRKILETLKKLEKIGKIVIRRGGEKDA